jgi:hypothetical protein
MMMRFLFLLLFFVVIWAPPAFAISFDIWETGMARQEIFSLAQQHDLPLGKSGLAHINKGFNPKLLVGDATSYYYPTTLLDHHARIGLHLSPVKAGYGQFLYEIEVLFTDIRQNKDLGPYVLDMLGEKYGRPSRATNIVQQHYVWHPEPNSEVRLITSGHTLQIKYTDLKVQAFARELSKSTFDLPQEPAHHQDAGKF